MLNSNVDYRRSARISLQLYLHEYREWSDLLTSVKMLQASYGLTIDMIFVICSYFPDIYLGNPYFIIIFAKQV